ncbi:class F sortase [Blastococcus sp. MG754426]|uniref:class F sortase n=1 Tax=unclassified Blastococcus TaxID=2619396 RepID=UPI001EF0D144|nr:MULTISPECIES: class F sortase [unclassified Blastococcus]MCF6509776.1 class F sortase [Blastococcus sp. MG754426]MCF6514511.1 class F sortase [Blastococcus sp. MG754427]
MRPTRGPDLRTAAAFVVVLAAGLAVLWVVTARPPAGEDVFALSEQAAAGPVEPAWLAIPAIGVDAPVEHRGTVTYENPFTGRTVEGYGVPESMLTTSWWSDGPAPGSGRMAVVLGHQQDGGDAVFDRLHELRPGDEVVLRDAVGAALRLTVLAEPLTGLDKATPALSDALNGHPAEADLALVTCGGEFDDAAGTSTDNTVVFATVTGGP